MPEGKVPLFELNLFPMLLLWILLLLIIFFTSDTKHPKDLPRSCRSHWPGVPRACARGSAKYTQLFTLFGQCHFKFNSSCKFNSKCFRQATYKLTWNCLWKTKGSFYLTFNLPHYAWSINKIVFFLLYFRRRHQEFHPVLPQQFYQGDISSKAPHVRGPCHSIYKEMQISTGSFWRTRRRIHSPWVQAIWKY